MAQFKLSKRGLINIGLAVAVIVLIGVLIYKPGKQDESEKIITAIDKATIKTISIQRTGNPDISFILDDKGWHMVKPHAIKANKIKLESLLDLLNYKYHARYDLAGLDKKKYGLDKPRTTITFNNNYKFEFGTTESINKHRYIRYQNQLYLTDDYYYHRVLGKPTSFLDHALLATDNNITRIDLPGLSLTMQDGKWLAKPRPKQFSNDQANELIDHWKHAHAIEMVDYPPVRGTGTVLVYINKRSTPVRFDIFSFNDEFYLGREDLKIAYKLEREKRRDLLKLPPPIINNTTTK